MAHNKERVEGLRQIMHLCGDYLPGLLPLIHKELEAETKKLMSEALHERNEHILAVRFAPPKAEPTTTKGKIDAKLEHIQQPLRIRALETPLVELDLQQKRQNELLKEFSKKIQSLESFAKIQGDKSSVIRPLQIIQTNIQNSNNIDFINQRVNNESLEKEFDAANEKILELLPTEHKENIPQKQRTRFDKIKPKNKYTLETQSDVEEFINELKSKMIEEINNGREITL